MTHLNYELELLKSELFALWELVIMQTKKAKDALERFDLSLAKEVYNQEKRVDAMELKIERDCENILALFSPVAIDLRLVLAVLKINNELERIGDMAFGIAKLIKTESRPIDKKLIETTNVLPMFEESISMLETTCKAFETEDLLLARTVFSKDEILDRIQDEALPKIADYILQYPDSVIQGLNMLSIVRRLERAGDHSTNIAEELIFYKDAIISRHAKKLNPSDLEGKEFNA